MKVRILFKSGSSWSLDMTEEDYTELRACSMTDQPFLTETLCIGTHNVVAIEKLI